MLLKRFNVKPSGTSGYTTRRSLLLKSPFSASLSTSSAHRLAKRCKFQPCILPAVSLSLFSPNILNHSVNGIYVGRIIYTPSSFLDIIPDRYKKLPISLYDPRSAPILNQYRLIVPRTRNLLEIMQFAILLCVYLVFMAERDPTRFSLAEFAFVVIAFGWVLDQFASILEHGWYE